MIFFRTVKLFIHILSIVKLIFFDKQVLAATQMPEEPAGWFQGTADAIRKFVWVLEVVNNFSFHIWSFSYSSAILFLEY